MRTKTVLAILGAVVLVVGISIGGWYLRWFLAKKTVENQYNINTHTQQYQSSLIQQERDTATGYEAAVDPAEKQYLKNQFCTMYLNLDPAPADLAAAHNSIC